MTDKTQSAEKTVQAAPAEQSATLKQMHRHRGELKKEGDPITARPATLAKLKERASSDGDAITC